MLVWCARERATISRCPRHISFPSGCVTKTIINVRHLHACVQHTHTHYMVIDLEICRYSRGLPNQSEQLCDKVTISVWVCVWRHIKCHPNEINLTLFFIFIWFFLLCFNAILLNHVGAHTYLHFIFHACEYIVFFWNRSCVYVSYIFFLLFSSSLSKTIKKKQIHIHKYNIVMIIDFHVNMCYKWSRLFIYDTYLS